MQRDLQELVPEARIGIAHGQMPERELEKVMLDFHKQRFNVLLCTTIIESGIDIPNANTIVMNRADKFGLAQLHQLRGRVGRSHHRAYAYLVVPDNRSISADARKRLDAIAAMDELGAGFTLATHDLEIRWRRRTARRGPERPDGRRSASASTPNCWNAPCAASSAANCPTSTAPSNTAPMSSCTSPR
jgi:RecG-like helicase